MSFLTDNVHRHLLPLYVLGTDINKIQEPMSRPNGYPNYQISICLEGEGIYIDENNIKYKIEMGDLFFFSPNVPHRYISVSENWRLPFIVFNGKCAADIVKYLEFGSSMVLKGISKDNFNTLITSFTNIYDTYFSNIPTKTERVSAMLYHMLVFISEIADDSSIAGPTSVMQYLAPALQYISSHIAEKNIKVEDVANVLQISTGRLSFLFNKAFNKTPVQVIREHKLEYAKHLLMTRPYMKMTDITEAAGFKSLSYFSTVFKKTYGVSPTEYKSSRNHNADDWW
ncbi:MAG TPA: helix-turn-helix transcriptional regulator [Candidatus Ornithomonoglobus merdipullorum]|mgnify:CR=1 FL=1|uniref:Helix-turn-helix transcriptional regulator n=1 Tax=Candidatus Ornithomonoglobus merdipullorum TaxID=2840895 RepID=A0A9D1MDH5_9FIRM|nr:helix-turn-helix transcriptional regulator [Candidatus Ornithomonoglobus merdipullorum]